MYLALSLIYCFTLRCVSANVGLLTYKATRNAWTAFNLGLFLFVAGMRINYFMTVHGV